MERQRYPSSALGAKRGLSAADQPCSINSSFELRDIEGYRSYWHRDGVIGATPFERQHRLKMMDCDTTRQGDACHRDSNCLEATQTFRRSEV